MCAWQVFQIWPNTTSNESTNTVAWGQANFLFRVDYAIQVYARGLPNDNASVFRGPYDYHYEKIFHSHLHGYAVYQKMWNAFGSLPFNNGKYYKFYLL